MNFFDETKMKIKAAKEFVKRKTRPLATLAIGSVAAFTSMSLSSCAMPTTSYSTKLVQDSSGKWRYTTTSGYDYQKLARGTNEFSRATLNFAKAVKTISTINKGRR